MGWGFGIWDLGFGVWDLGFGVVVGRGRGSRCEEGKWVWWWVVVMMMVGGGDDGVRLKRVFYFVRCVRDSQMKSRLEQRRVGKSTEKQM